MAKTTLYGLKSIPTLSVDLNLKLIQQKDMFRIYWTPQQLLIKGLSTILIAGVVTKKTHPLHIYYEYGQ